MVVSERASSFAPLHSLRMFIARSGRKQIYGVYERPPYPIIIDKPTVKDIVSNFSFPDYVMGATIYGTGLLLGYSCSRGLLLLQQRLLVYHIISHLGFVVGVSSMLACSFRRLTGFYDNGLRWKKPEDKLRKYDNTSHYEAATVWKYISHSRE